MDSPIEQKALEYIESLPVEARFLAYLNGYPGYKGGPEDFPNSINLSYFEKYLKELDEFKPKSPDGQEAEAGIIIYWDEKENKIKSTTSTNYKETEVFLDHLQVLRENNRLLLDGHTHPGGIQELPSIVDYTQLLQGDPKTRWRVLRAMIVLSPNCQILAVTTDQTPILYPEDLEEFLKPWEHPSPAKIRNKAFSRYEKVNKITKQMIEQLALEQAKNGVFTLGQAEEIIKKAIKIDRRISEIASDKLESSGKLMNLYHVEFPRKMGIKLYQSFDFQNFTSLTEV